MKADKTIKPSMLKKLPTTKLI